MENLDNAEEDEGCDAEVLSSVAAEATLTDKQVACTVHTAYCTMHVVKLHLFGKLIMRSGFGLIGLLWVQQFCSGFRSVPFSKKRFVWKVDFVKVGPL